MNLTLKAHALAGEFLRRTRALFVLDATMGRGHDTLFFAKNLPSGGKVFSFDIQADALESTRTLLKSEKISAEKYELFEASHDLFVEKLGTDAKKLSCAMFNLGWLPKSDKKIVTQAQVTLNALEKLCEVFENKKSASFLSILSYRGHKGGLSEYVAISDFFSKLQAKKEIYSGMASGISPVLFTAEFR